LNVSPLKVSKRLWAALLAIGLFGWLFAAITHANAYFLLADDHAIVGGAASWSLTTIFHGDQFGMYRPLGFVVAKAAAPFIESPFGWSAIVLCLHALNAGLLGLVASRLGQDTRTAATVALFFLWSPWSSEAYFWFSGIFDVGATFGILVATVAVTSRAASSRAWFGALVLTIAGCAVSAGFKETGYLAPLVVSMLTVAEGRQGEWRRRGIAVVAAAACALAIYLYRSHLLANSGTPYDVSEFGARLLTLSVLPTAASQLLALLLWPVPEVWGQPGRFLATFWVWPVGASMTAALCISALLTRRRAWVLVLVLLVSIAPTAFYHLVVQSITPRRYLYLAGVSLCLLLGMAMAEMDEIRPRRVGAHMALISLLLLAMAGAAASQVRLWSMASRTARCAVESFGTRVLPRAGSQYVENFPFVVEHGPFILLEYDFPYYYKQRWTGVDVAYRRTVLSFGPSGGFIVQGHDAPPADAQARTAVSLELCLGQR
jgi:hypothetical protein